MILLNILTGDGDRAVRSSGKHHNLTFSDGKAVYFDFEFCHSFFRDTAVYTKELVSCLESSEDVRQYVAEKIQRMKTYWESEEGYLQARSAFEFSGVRMHNFYDTKLDTTFDDFFKLLLKRVHDIERALTRIDEYQDAA